MTLDARKGRILQAIVNEYVQSAEPVGSEWLAAHHDFGCKSATLRNEMAEMSGLGYLVQPHTSAGRIPSNRGYRYFVDRLMPSPEHAQTGSPLRELDIAGMPVNEIVHLTCRVLADMTRYPSVATTPQTDAARLQRLYVAPAGPKQALVVLLFSSGHVQHRLLDLTHAPREAALHRVTNFLNDALAGRELAEVAASKLSAVPAELGAERKLLAQVHGVVADVARGLSDDRLFLEGAAHILRQREFQDVLRLEQLLSALEHRSVLYRVFSRAYEDDVTVIIGTEAPVEAMYECSVVTSAYQIGGRRGGYIGVVGPTRMDYERAVSAVRLMAQSLSSLLTRGVME